jgi:hypothetical protein
MRCDIAHIEIFFGNQTLIIERLLELSEISLASDFSNSLSKVLIIASASYFEDCITSYIKEFVEKNSNSEMLREFFRIRAIERQYHTWFDWEKQNASKFFSLFGSGAKQRLERLVSNDDNIEQSIRDFLLLGSQRNLIAHKNLLNYPISDTPFEIHKRIYSASRFLEFMELHVFETR